MKKQQLIPTSHKIKNFNIYFFIRIILFFITFLIVELILSSMDVNAAFKDINKVLDIDSSYYQGAIFLRKDSQIIADNDCDSNIKIINSNKKLVKFISQGDYVTSFKITNCAYDADGDLCDVKIWTSDYYNLKDSIFNTYDGIENCKYRIEVIGGTFTTTSKCENVYFHLETAAVQLKLNFQYYKAGTTTPANISKQFGKVMDIDVYCFAESMKTTMHNGCEGFRIKKENDTVIYKDTSISSALSEYEDDSQIGVYNDGNGNREDYANNDPRGIAYYKTSFNDGKTYLAYEGRICGIYFTYTSPNLDYNYTVKYDSDGGISSKNTETCLYGKEYIAATATKTGYQLKYWESPRENGYDSVRSIKDGTYYLKLGNTHYLKMERNSTEENVNAIINQNTSENYEQWDIKYMGDGYYTIKNLNSGKYLSIKDGNKNPKTAIQQKNFVNKDNYLWKIMKNDWYSNNSYSITSKIDGTIGELTMGTDSNTLTDNKEIHTQFLNRGIKSRSWYLSLVDGGDYKYTSVSKRSEITPGGKIYNLGEKNSTITLKAIWNPNTYKIHYDGNGATSGTTNDTIHTYDQAKNLTTNGFKKSGYVFAGWSTTPNGQILYKDKESVINLSSTNNSIITLYAQWTDLSNSAKGNNVIIIKSVGEKMIENNSLEDFLKKETALKIEENDENITIKDYTITNLAEIKEEIKNTTVNNKIEIKFKIEFSNDKTSTNTIEPCTLTIINQSSTNLFGYIRYITDSNTLYENSDWIKDTHKQAILDEALHKQPNELLENNFTIYK